MISRRIPRVDPLVGTAGTFYEGVNLLENKVRTCQTWCLIRLAVVQAPHP